MGSSPIDDLSKKIDKHFEKTGVVLVGMHQELQEQKRRIGQYHDKVDAVTSDLARRSDEIVAELRSRAEAAVGVLDDVEHLLARIQGIAKDADVAIQQSNERLLVAQEALLGERDNFRADAEQLTDSIKQRIADFSKETELSIRLASENFEKSLNASKAENAAALNAVVETFSKNLADARSAGDESLREMVTNQKTALSEATDVFSESVLQLDVRLKGHLEAHQRFFKAAHDELSSRQRASDEAFADLKREIEKHQNREAEFSQKTRRITIALVAVGFAAMGILIYLQRVSL